MRAALLAAVALAAPRADAQRNGEEWLAAHTRAVRAAPASTAAALALQRLRGLRDFVDPLLLLDRTQSLRASPALPPLRRAAAAQLEAELRRDLGQTAGSAAMLRELGWITRWSVVGPFENEGRNAFARVLPPEQDRGAPPSPEATFEGLERPVRWRVMPDLAHLGMVPLDALVRPSVNACAFAHTTVTAPAAMPATLWVGAAGAVAAWVNGAEVLRDAAVRRVSADRSGAAVRLRAGANRVMLKLCTDDRGMAFFARLTRPNGAPLANLAVDPNPAAAPTISPLPVTAAPPEQGVLATLRAAAARPGATAQSLEDYARWLALTGADDPADPQAADLAERAARAQPTVSRWMLLAELSTDRNRRLQALQRAYALAPGDAHVLSALGHERRVGVHPEESLPYLDAAMRGDDGFVLPWIEHALALDDIGLQVTAHERLTEAAARAPRTAALLRARIGVAEHAGQHDEATRLRRALREIRATDLDVLEGLARDARAVGDRPTVVALAEEMLALRPDRLSVYSTAAGLLESAGEGARGAAVLARACEDIAPEETGLWRARAELEERLGHRDDARAAMRRVLALRPQDREVRAHLEALEPSEPRADEALAEEPAAFLARRGDPASPQRAEDFHVRSLQELTARTVYANGLSGMFRQAVYEVRTEQGARDGRVYTMSYDPESQRFELRAARVHHRDGSVEEGVQLDEFAVNSDPSMRMYFTNRVAQVRFANLAPGDVVELRWRVDDVSFRNVFADYFGDLQLVQAEVPRARFRYVLRAPRGRRFYFSDLAPAGLPALRHEERDDGDARVHTFSADDVPALHPEERAPGRTERGMYLHVSTYRTWAEVGAWWWGLVRDQLVADDRLRATVRRITAGMTDPRDKVRAVYDWVIANTRYVALEFGIHGYKPYAVPQVCTRGFGDCKDKASVIVTMLREAGVEAHLVLIRTRDQGTILAEPASLAVFNHAIAYVPSLDLYLDGTAQNSGMNELPSGDQGASALVVDPSGGARFVTTPVFTAAQNVTRVEAAVRVDADGAAEFHVTQSQRGPDAGGVRARLSVPATRAERIEDDLRDRWAGIRVTAVRAGDLTDVEADARFEYDARLPQLGTRQGADMLLHGAAPMDLSRRYAARTNRRYDLVLGVPSTLDETRRVTLPAGASAVDVPPAVEIDNEFGRFEYRVTASGSTLLVRRVLTLRRDRVTPQEYPAFRAFCSAVDEALARRVTVRLPGGAR
ncbi:MAG: DUF3857 domain-containing protein [Polyangiales bacterium]